MKRMAAVLAALGGNARHRPSVGFYGRAPRMTDTAADAWHALLRPGEELSPAFTRRFEPIIPT